MTSHQIEAEKYKQMLRSLIELPDNGSDKLFRVAGIVAEYIKLKYNIRLTVVGGLSVEIYTKGGYATQDIDFVGVGHEQIMNALVELGFERKGKDSYHEELNAYVEVPDSKLKDADERYVRQVQTQDGFLLTVIGKEDIIKDRLRSYIHWEQLRDREWTYNLIKRHLDDIDVTYIKETISVKEKEVFIELLHLAQEVNKEESRQAELLFYMDRYSVPYTTSHENVIVLPYQNTFVGFSLAPFITSYVIDESEDEDMLMPFQENLTSEELVNWLQTIPLTRKKELITGIHKVYYTI